KANDALDSLHMTKAPQLEILLYIDQLFAHLICVPVFAWMLVDLPKDLCQLIVFLMRLRPIARDVHLRNSKAAAFEMPQKFIIETGGLKRLQQILMGLRIMGKDFERIPIFIT